MIWPFRTKVPEIDQYYTGFLGQLYLVPLSVFFYTSVLLKNRGPLTNVQITDRNRKWWNPIFLSCLRTGQTSQLISRNTLYPRARTGRRGRIILGSGDFSSLSFLQWPLLLCNSLIIEHFKAKGSRDQQHFPRISAGAGNQRGPDRWNHETGRQKVASETAYVNFVFYCVSTRCGVVDPVKRKVSLQEQPVSLLEDVIRGRSIRFWSNAASETSQKSV